MIEERSEVGETGRSRKGSQGIAPTMDEPGRLPSSPPSITTSPLVLLTWQPSRIGARTTEELESVAGASPVAADPLSLAAALQSTMTVNTGKRPVVIPGSMKRAQAAAESALPGKRLSRRLRHAIVLSIILGVLVTSLLSLGSLASGQEGSSVFIRFGNWVHAQQLNWQITSHDNIVQSNPPATQNQPPAMYLPKSQYIAIAQQDASNAGISPNYFVRQINVESGFNPRAYSPSGAEGIAQFMPGTAAGLGIDPWDPVQALRGAAHLMAGYDSQYGGDYAKALAAYNGGSGTVQYAVNACGANWMNCLPGQTRNYIYQIMGI